MQSGGRSLGTLPQPWAYFHRADERPPTPRPLIRDCQKRLVLARRRRTRWKHRGTRFSTAGQMNDEELERQAPGSSRFALFRSPDGSSVAEVDLGHGAGALPRLIEEARSAGAQRMWVHATAVDADLGFRQVGGYARLEAEHLSNRVDLA